METMKINIEYNWGGLVNPEQHVAAVGARLADNRSRDFGVFGNRITVVGRDNVAKKLYRWLFSKKTLKAIAKASRFVWGGDAVEQDLELSLNKDYTVHIHLRCVGEYCYVAAYADALQEKEYGK